MTDMQPDMRTHIDPEEWAKGLMTGLEDRGYGGLDPHYANALHEEAAEMAERVAALSEDRIAELEALNAELYAALEALVLNRWDVVNHYTHGQPFDHPLVLAAFAALAKADGREETEG